MAITGNEANIIRRHPNGTEESLPCTEKYNHHYTDWMHGKDAVLVELPREATCMWGEHAPTMDVGHMQLPRWRLTQDGSTIPKVQTISEGNGNEARGAFKGYARGFAQLIASPTYYLSVPMIINTNKKLTNDTSPGPINHELLPRNSLAPPDALYSGIDECPCTTRTTKILDSYVATSHGHCEHVIETPEECEAAARILGLTPVTPRNVSRNGTLPAGCSAISTNGTWKLLFNFDVSSSSQCGAGAPREPRAVGSASALPGVVVQLDIGLQGKVRITLRSNATTVWFGVGFNATRMYDRPYAIIVLPGSAGVQERKLGDHQQGIELEGSVEVVSDTTVDGERVVVLERKLQGRTEDYFSFNPSATSIPFISALGCGPTFAHHCSKGGADITLAQWNATTCLCRDKDGNAGSIDGVRFNPQVCAPYPTSDLWTTHNGICDIKTYGGGLLCCKSHTILLDADQEVPDATDEYQLKYRFYYEDYTNQQNTFRLWWSTEAWNNEYDIPKSKANCLDPATPVEQCEHRIRSEFHGVDVLSMGNGCAEQGDPNTCGNVTKIREEDGGKFLLIYAAPHCHAPACKALELWNNDTGELICRSEPVYGTGMGAMDEDGYIIGIPPCVWGSKEEGLAPPPVLSLDSNLTVLKIANNTYGHWGVMALWQMRGAYLGIGLPVAA
eukprot:NODE_109_length_2084_cov_290.840315.p1 GENE.NODE_109_length_2084_cov_290.840315~~NODE_109_length_2084_cov_290.840315.p1  ORF type:complete len:681 (+),score=169.76 NODE_109_length_2084_cov_290.840315:29-2044(+)